MQWVLDNWLLVLLVGGMIAMHLGHGKHGGKGGHGAGEARGHDADKGAGQGTCNNTGHKCCGGHKKQPVSEPVAKPAKASETVTGKSQIPKIN
jgi:hypothetical protein